MVSKFSEQETESYYDAEDVIYRAVWDEDGSVHWGYFDDTTGTDFLKGCALRPDHGREGPHLRRRQGP